MNLFQIALKPVAKIGVMILVLTTMGVAFAQMKPEHTIKYRQSVMYIIGWDFYGKMTPMIKGKKPFDTKIFAQGAQRASLMLPMAAEGFTKGTDVGKTKAKSEIWSNMDDFKQKMTDAVNATNKLAEVSKTGDEVAMRKQFTATNKTCIGCHKKYRKKNK